MKTRSYYFKCLLFISFLLSVAASLPNEALSGHTDALLLSCMDYRLVDDTERYMDKRGMREKYDHVILAGASLGATTEKYPAWNQTFWDHLDVAIGLHSIKKVIILDHRDCGAYKVILGEDFSKDPNKEKSVHAEKLFSLSKMIKEKFSDLEIELHLMDLSGNVEKISD